MKITLDDGLEIPKYQQIAGRLSDLILRGELRAGQRLPAERDFGRENGLARGTVKMAYQELIKTGAAYSIRGSGTYIADQRPDIKKESLSQEVEGIFDRAEELGLPVLEVVELFRKVMVRRIAGDVKLMTAWVDCCPEALLLARNEFKNVENNSIQQFFIDDVLKEPKLLEAGFELIVTTTHHYETLIQAFPRLKNKIEVVTIVPGKDSIVELAQIQPEDRVIFWSVSKRFDENIQWLLRDFENVHIARTFVSDREIEAVEQELMEADVLLVPKEYRVLGEPSMVDLVEQHQKRGGRVLQFTYEFDQGSLLHLQTYICERIAEKEKVMLQ